MSDSFNEQELIQFIANRLHLESNEILLVLKHERAFIEQANEDAHGAIEVDSDELMDYIASKPDIHLDEQSVEKILDTEMDYLMDKGLAGNIEEE
jgi:ApbE superfamily uncharacterized protein (UPF0280 family)